MATQPLPTVSLLNSVMTVQSYLRAVDNTRLPPVITQNAQYASLVTQFTDWQQDLWAQFWEGLVAGGISAQSEEANNLFGDQVDDQTVMQNIFYDDGVAVVAAQCLDVANFVTNGEPLLEQLQDIATSIEDADKAQVAKFTALVDQLQDQFSQQEDTLTQDAIDSATEVVSTAVDVAIAVGSEGEDIEPLIKGVIKLGEQAIDELVLTDEINQTLSDLETAWEELDQATTDLTQITLTCQQIKAVTDQASETLAELQKLSDNWMEVAGTTQDSAADWADGGQAALQQWAALMVKVSFSNATQAVDAKEAAATVAMRSAAAR